MARVTTRRTQSDRSESTRATLRAAARRLFAARGYAHVSVGNVVTAAAVTRGALYHHYADKRALFLAVFEEVEEDVANRVATASLAGAGDMWWRMKRTVSAFLDVCLDPEVARIALLDAPSVLGWDEWRAVEARYGLGLVAGGLEQGMADGSFARQPVTPLADVLFGAITEAGLLIANSEEPRTTRTAVERALLTLLEGVRARAHG
jgi:AcrR family transcriptional regulator